MSAALWNFFWNRGATPAPAPAPAPTGGSGGKRKRKQTPDYIPAPDDFWGVRERYLKALLAEHEQEPPPAPKPVPSQALPPKLATPTALPRLIAERATAIRVLHLAENLKQLQASGARLVELNTAISLAKRQQLEYLSQQTRARHKRQLIRARRKAALLIAAHTLLKMLYPRNF